MHGVRVIGSRFPEGRAIPQLRPELKRRSKDARVSRESESWVREGGKRQTCAGYGVVKQKPTAKEAGEGLPNGPGGASEEASWRRFPRKDRRNESAEGGELGEGSSLRVEVRLPGRSERAGQERGRVVG